MRRGVLVLEGIGGCGCPGSFGEPTAGGNGTGKGPIAQRHVRVPHPERKLQVPRILHHRPEEPGRLHVPGDLQDGGRFHHEHQDRVRESQRGHALPRPGHRDGLIEEHRLPVQQQIHPDTEKRSQLYLIFILFSIYFTQNPSNFLTLNVTGARGVI